MRGTAGLHIQKQVSPAFALGVESLFGINTSTQNRGISSSTVFDNSYVGAYGAVNLFNLFGGYKCDGRAFDIEVAAGAGWGHTYYNKAVGSDHNYFATKAGLNFNFNVTRNLTISVKPSVIWDMSDVSVAQTSAAYDIHKANFNLVAGVTYKFGEGFRCADVRNIAEIDALNAQINQLRGELDACAAAVAAGQAQNAALAAELAACQNKKPEVVKEVNNTLNSVRYIFYRIGSSVITPDQQPNVEMVAAYLKNHKDAKVVIKGYASQDGNEEFNIKLAEARAQSVKTALMKKYGIAESRIQAEGQGIGHMFSEESWNRVSICTIED
ncbi:MAG: OmpA family protein [Muribaculaceae bacterium]|nr:OmpA family protein [Muribaculaceae bacterium]